MNRYVLCILLAAVITVPAYAGGPNVRVKPVQKPKASERIIEHLMETEPAEKSVSKEMEVPAQPSGQRMKETVQEQSAVARMEKPKVVTVLFESTPANAELLINGLYVGSTPVQLPLRDGVHFIKLILPKYKTWERQVKVYQGLRVFTQLESIEEPKKQ